MSLWLICGGNALGESPIGWAEYSDNLCEVFNYDGNIYLSRLPGSRKTAWTPTMENYNK